METIAPEALESQIDWKALDKPPGSDNSLYRAVEIVESGGNPNAISDKGALGPMQTMPGTLRDPGYGVRPASDPSDIEEQRRVGRDYLDAMMRKYGDLDTALMAYNWGPGNVNKWIASGRDPSKVPRETSQYLAKIKSQLDQPEDSPGDALISPDELEKSFFDKESPTFFGSVKEGFLGGLLGTNPQMGGVALQILGRKTGIDRIANMGTDIEKYGNKRLSEHPGRVVDWTKIRSLDDFIEYSGYGLGQGLASTVPSAVAGGATALVTANPLMGFVLGGTFPSYMQNLGDVGLGLRNELAKDLKSGKVTQDQLDNAALLAAVPMAGLDVVSLGGILTGSLTKSAKQALRRNIVRRVASLVAKGATLEGVTEGLQETISQWAQSRMAGRSGLDVSQLIQISNDAFFGMLTGGVLAPIGGAGGKKPGPENQPPLELTDRVEPAPDTLDLNDVVEPPAPRQTPPPTEAPAQAVPDEDTGIEPLVYDDEDDGEPTPTPETVEAAAAETEQPTQGQAKADNYKQGHIDDYKGLRLTIETPRGGTRRDAHNTPPKWEVANFPAHYGKILGTKGADGEHLDFFLGDNLDSNTAYVIDQVDPETGKFDEHKVMLGFGSRDDAVSAYSRAFTDGKGSDRIGGVTEMSINAFRDLAENPLTEALAPRPPESQAPATSPDIRPEKPADEPEPITAPPPQAQPETASQASPLPEGARILKTGDVIITKSGRETDPVPRLDMSTPRHAKWSLRRFDAWLRRMAVRESMPLEYGGRREEITKKDISTLTDEDRADWFKIITGDQPLSDERIISRLLQKRRRRAARIQRMREGGYNAPGRPEGPLSLSYFLANKGGIKDESGELTARDLHLWHIGKPFQKKLVNPDGMDYDSARELAEEAAYLPEGSDINDLLDALDQDQRGPPVYSAVDQTEADETATQRRRDFEEDIEANHKSDIEAYAKENGITLTDEEIDLIGSRYAGGENLEDAVSEVLDAGSLAYEAQLVDTAKDENDGTETEIPFDIESGATSRPRAQAEKESVPAKEPEPGTEERGAEARKQPDEAGRDQRTKDTSTDQTVKRPTIDQTDQGEQSVIPGAEKRTESETAAHKEHEKRTSAEELKRLEGQQSKIRRAGQQSVRDIEGGLFDANRDQLDIEAIAKEEKSHEIEPQATEAPADTLLAAGLNVKKSKTRKGNDVWEVTGKTYDHRAILKELGGWYYGGNKTWSFYDGDPTQKIADKLRGTIADESGEGRPGRDVDNAATERDRHGNMERQRKREAEDARPDESRIGKDRNQFVSDETRRLIERGVEFNIPRDVIDEQIEDIALINRAYQNDKPVFVLANEAGTGKTFVLGGAIRELRKAGAKKFIYVTLSQDLIAQIKRNLSDYDIGDVKFHTYADISTGKNIDASDSILIFDETHNIKNITANRGKAAQRLMANAKYVILASATPFENPVQAGYLAATGIFDRVGGFDEWAKIYGAAVRRGPRRYNNQTRRYERQEKVYWPGGKERRRDAQAARQWFINQGIFTQRAKRISGDLVTSTFRRVQVDQEYIDLYQKVEAAYMDALRVWQDDNGNPLPGPTHSMISMHMTNTLKRILEAAKAPEAIKSAKNEIANGRRVVIFVETKADRFIGKFARSDSKDKKTRYSYPEIAEMMAEWRAEKSMRQYDGERRPPPFAGFIETIAQAMHAHGIDYQLPSVPDLIRSEFKKNEVGFYTGDVTMSKASKAKDAWMNNEFPVLVATMAKGGTGLSLHDETGNNPTSQININLPWSGTQLDQVSSRTARYGLRSHTIVDWMFAPGIPVEEKLSRRVGGRLRDLGATVKGIDVAEAEAMADWNFEDNYIAQGLVLGRTAEKAPDIQEDIYEIAERLERNRKHDREDARSDFFPTPYPLSALMSQLAGIRTDDVVLEPSAGTGHLLKFLPDKTRVIAYEARPDNSEKLLSQYGETHDLSILGDDFMAAKPDAVIKAAGAHPSIVLMNPPFSHLKGHGKQDILHVKHAFNFLPNRGRLIAIVGEGTFFRSDRQSTEFRQWLDAQGATVISLPINTFLRSGTGVKTRLIVIDKGADPGMTEINADDYDSIRDIEGLVPPRLDPVNPEKYSLGNRRTSQYAMQRHEIIKIVKNEIRRMAPKAKVDVVDNIFREVRGKTRKIAGVYSPERQIITISLQHGDPIVSAHHETIHALYDMGMFSASEWKIFMNKATEWRGRYQIDKFYSGQPETILNEEAVAHAFTDSVRGARFSGTIQAAFDRVSQFFERIGNALRGLGFKSARDVFQDVYVGAVGSREGKISSALDELLNTGEAAEIAQERLKRVKKKIGQKPQTLGTQIRDKLHSITHDLLRQMVLDDVHGMGVMERAENGGELMPGKRSAYKLARVSRGMHDMVYAALYEGAPIWKEGAVAIDPDTKPLMQIVEGLDDRLGDFDAYLALRRARELMDQGRENLFTDADIEIIDDLEKANPDFVRRAREIQNFNQKLLDFAQQSGLLNDEMRAFFDEMHKNYVPFWRIMEEGGVKSPKARRGFSGQHPNFFRLTGGTQNIEHPLINLEQNIQRLIEASVRNVVMLRAEQINARSGFAYMTRVKRKVAKSLVSTRQMIKDLQAQGADVDITELPDIDALRLLWSFGHAPKGGNIVSHMRGGEVVFHEVEHPLLLRALTQVHRSRIPWIMPLKAAKHVLTSAVALEPSFQFANVVRDTVHASVISHFGFKPVKDSLVGAYQQITQSPEFREFIAGGGGMSAMVEADRPDMRATMTAKLGVESGSAQLVNTLKKWIGMLEHYESVFEYATRVGAFKKLRDDGVPLLDAIYQSREISTDFAMRGDWIVIRLLAETVPFFNAGVQGLYRTFRGVAENPLQFAMKGSLLMAASIMLYLMNRDDDRFKELPQWERDTYWHFWIADQHYRIPKPFEVGVFFGSLPERMAELAIEREGEEFAKRLWWMFTEMFRMDVIPQLLRPPLRVYANWDEFRVQPIVPPWLEAGVRPEEQYDSRTSQLAIATGRALKISPKKIETLVNGYIGAWGSYLFTMSDIIYQSLSDGPAIPSIPWQSRPVIRRFVGAKIPHATRYLNELYEMRDEANRVYGSYRKLVEEGEIERARELIQKNKGKLAARDSINLMTKAIARLGKMQSIIRRDRNMTAQEKRDRIDKLTLIRNELARKANKLRDVMSH